MSFMRFIGPAFFSIAMLSMPIGALAATKTWDSGGSGGNCSTGANWNGDTAPSTGDDVIINAAGKNIVWDASCPTAVNSLTINSTFTGSVTVNTRYSGTGFTLFTITDDLTVNGGTMTHIQNTTTQTYRLRLAVGGDLTVGSNGAISADGKGFYIGANNGPIPGGYGTGTITTRFHTTGGGYGGQGGPGIFFPNEFGKTYGSITKPLDIGSTGTVNLGGPSAAGGAIMLSVSGSTTVNGTISSNGLDVTGDPAYVGGPSGGSVYITTSSFGGTGIMSVNGGSSYGGGYGGGGGGGGRMAIILSGGSTFGSVTLRASGGGFHDFWDYAGGNDGGAPGTIYLQTQNQTSTTGQLVIPPNYLYYDATNGVSPSFVALSGVTEYPVRYYTSLSDTQRQTYSFSSVTVGHGARLKVASDDALTVTSGGSIAIADSGALLTNVNMDLTGISFSNGGLLQGTGSIVQPSTFSVSPSSVAIGSPVTITVIEPTKNTNGKTFESLTIMSDQGALTLTETSIDSGIFLANVRTVHGVKTYGDDTIENNDFCSFTMAFSYTDSQDATDTDSSSISLTDAAVSCDGIPGGGGGTRSQGSGGGGSNSASGGPSPSRVFSSPIVKTPVADTHAAASVNPRVKALQKRADLINLKVAAARTPLQKKALQRSLARLQKTIDRLK